MHDWGRQSSQEVSHQTYQKAKYLAMGDCWLRARGVSDFMAVGDIDEVRLSEEETLVAFKPCLHTAHMTI